MSKAIHLYKLMKIYFKKYIKDYAFSAFEIRVKNEVVHRRIAIGQSGQIFKLSASCPQVVRLSASNIGWWRVFSRRGYFRAFRLFFALVLKGFCKFLSCFDFRSLTGVLMQRI